jgi:hypothetical protein
MPVWTPEDDERDGMPSMFIHVRVTVFRRRLRSVLEDDDTDHRFPRHRPQYASLPKQKVSPHRKSLPINDKRINDPRFQKKYRWN